MKSALAGSVVALVVILLVLAVPWYPLTTSQVVPQAQSYTTQFEGPTTTYQTVTVYTLPSPVQLLTANFNGGTCAWGPSYCNTALYFTSETFSLQANVTYTVSVNQCQECALDISKATITIGTYNYFAPIAGSGETAFVAPASTLYEVVVANGGFPAGMLNAISITGSVPQSVELMQTVTTYSVTSVTEYSQTMVPFYTILGVVASTILLALAMSLVVLSLMLHWGIITVSTKRRKRRKR